MYLAQNYKLQTIMKRLTLLAIAMCLCTAAFAQQSKVVAHRGYWKTLGSAQNSIRSLVKADSIHCWGSEFDVWSTSDGVLVVNHDASVNGIAIATSHSHEVLSQTLANGEYLPSLESYLEQCKLCPDINVVLELKSHTDKKQEEKAVKKAIKLIKRYGLENRTTYITFSKEATLNFIKYAPKGTEVYYLSGDIAPKELKAMGCAGLDYHLGVMKEHPEWIEQCHQLGLKVNIWTVNAAEDLQWCIDHNADFITTNEPELLQQLLK